MWHISIQKVKTYSDRHDRVLPFNLWLLSYFFEVIPATGSESWVHVILVIPPSQTGNSSFIMCIFYHLIYSLCLLYHSVLSLQKKKNISCIPLSKLLPILYKICKAFFGKKVQTSLKCKPNIQTMIFLIHLWNR